MVDGLKKYTVTVYIAAPGTPIHKNGKLDHSLVGHLYYKVSDGTEAGTKGYGFAPAKEGQPFGPGKVKHDEYKEYQGPVYERQLEITEAQYKKLVAYGETPSLGGFDKTKYNGLNNSCIDFLYNGLAYSDIYNLPKAKIEVLNKTLFEKSNEGTVTVRPNAIAFDKIPYQIGDERNPLNTPPNQRLHENPSCTKAFGFSWKTAVCWLAENEREQPYQYAQAAGGFSPDLQPLHEKARTLLAECNQREGICQSETEFDNTAAYLTTAMQKAKMTDVDGIGRMDGKLHAIHDTEELDVAIVDPKTAAQTPVADSVAQSQQTAQRFENEEQQKQYAQSQSRGMSMA